MADKLGIGVEETISDVTLVSPLGQSVTVNKIYRGCPLEVQGEIFSTDLMELSFGEFDLILGVVWLVKHQVSLDYASKRVTLKTSIGEEIVMVGERRDYLSNVISTLVDQKVVHKGCKAYLTYVLDTSVSKSPVKSMRTVREFLDVFLKELPRLSPEREVKFRIYLLLRMASMTIYPYHMAPKELNELKVQL